MILLDGKTLSEKILAGLKPHGSLHIILVGDDPASLKYVNLKQKKCQQIGQDCIIHHLPSSVPTPDILQLIADLNTNPEVSGFFVQLPLPSHCNKTKIIAAINPKKDVDGLTPNSPYTPAVVRGIIRLLDEYHLSLYGKNAVIINDSDLIGKPLQKILIKRKINVTLCNDQTKNLAEITRQADLLISATGVKNLITDDYVKAGAIVVDVANGDVDFANVNAKASYITPSFGGVGPMTIACLLENLTMVK